MASRNDVEFKTLDGLTLRGTLYRTGMPTSPAVILAQGFNCTKEMFVPDVAAHFQAAGFIVLTFDQRTIGSSDGTPRNDIDPSKQVEDISDALSFLKEVPGVLVDKIALWGFSFGATVSLSAAALDKRAKAIVAVCPLTCLEFTPEKRPLVLAKALRDRESRLLGNRPFYLPMVTESGDNPAGFGLGIDDGMFQILTVAKETIAPMFENRTTVQSYYKIFSWQPFELWAHLAPTPVLFVTPELDKISPFELQQKYYRGLSEPKRMHVEPGKGHMDVLSGDTFSETMDLQVQFFRDAFDGKIGTT